VDLTTLLDMAISGFPERVLIGSLDGGMTPVQLKEKATSGAALISQSGNDAVAYLTTNGPAFPVAMFAAAYAEVPLIPMNYRLGPEQLQRQLDNHPKALVVTDGQTAQRFDAEDTVILSTDDLLNLSIEPSRLTPNGDIDPDCPAVVIYTSGTTSAPKGVVLRHRNLVSYILASVDFGSAGSEDAALVSVPPYHIAAVASVISNLYAGRRTVILEQFAPDRWLETLRQEGITNALVVPTMLSRVLEGGTDLRVPTLRSLAYGGAPMPAPVILRALEEWPHVGFVNAYGLTETSSTIAVLDAEDHRASQASSDPRIRSRLSSVGKPLPNLDVRILAEDGQEVEPGVPGRVCVRGEQVSAEYAGIGRALDSEGFFDTRDNGYLDDGGYLYIVGRADDTIIRGGENIAPAEIEEVLLKHVAVSDVAVVGIPDEEWGQRLEAAVVLRPESVVDETELREFARKALRSSKTPDRILFLESLPRTETGKLIRREVVRRIVDEAGGV
jgi:acyl-CoA synthetase (AMP-forming)/AMP-acid ligase II